MAHEYAKTFYSSSKWTKCKDGFMKSKHNICERCGGIAKICHHKTYITPDNINDMDITLNWDNLEALCQDCHNKEHMTSKSCIEGVSFDDEGNLIYKKVEGNDCT